MTLKHLRLVVCLGVVLLASATDAFATHFRAGTIRWRHQVDIVSGVPTPRPNIIIFTLTSTWRRTYFSDNFGVTPVVGTILPAFATFCFGDGQCVNVAPTVTSLSATEDWVETVFTVTKTYPATNATWTAFLDNCCRISTLLGGNNDSNFFVRTVVPISMTVPNSSPSSGTLPIISVPHNTAAATFSIAASDPENDAINYSVAPTSRSGLNVAAPMGLTINASTGLVTWDTRPVFGSQSAVLNGLYAVQFLVNDSKGASVPVDVILRPVSASLQAPTLLINGSASPASFTVPVGTPVSFTVTGTDPNNDPGTGLPNRFVTLSSSGVPVGAVLNPTLPTTLRSPANSTFSWTPTTTSVGTHTLTFGVTSGTGQQDTNNVTIIVPQFNRAPTIGCDPPVTVPFGTAATREVDVADPDSDPLTVEWSVAGVVVRTDNISGTVTPTTLSFTQQYGPVGNYPVSVRVQDSKGLSATCTTAVNVIKADQTITFAAIGDQVHGAPALSLTPTASSTLPVTLELVSGPAMLNGTSLALTGVGLVHVRATQAGDGNYNAAPPEDRTVDVGPATLTISVAAASTVYTGVSYAGTTQCSAAGVNGETPPASLSYETSGGTATGIPTNAGSYNAVCSAGGGNYVSASKKAAFTIAPATLTLSVSAANTNYTGLAYSGATACSAVGVNNEMPTASLSFEDGAQQPIGTPKDAGSYFAACSAGGGNYQPASSKAPFSIGQAPLTIAVTAASTVYTALPYAGATSCAATGVNGETPTASGSFQDVTGTVLGGAPTAAGSYRFACSAGGGNYANASDNAPFDIARAGLTGAFTASNKFYDGNTDASIATRSLTGVLDNDEVALVGGAASFADKNAGANKTVSGTGFALAGADKYNYSLGSVSDATAAIQQKSIGGSITAANKGYDGNDVAAIVTRLLSGVVPGDAVELIGGAATFNDKNVGTNKPVTGAGFTLFGSGSGNYQLSGVSNTTASILARALQGSFTAADRLYDGTVAATITGHALNGAISGDDVAMTGGTATFNDKHAGTGKPVSGTGFTLTGAAKDNYALGPVAGTTASIQARPITGRFNAADKVYDGTVQATITGRLLDGVLSEDDVQLTGGAATFDSPGVGTDKTVTGAGFQLGGATKNNYDLTSVGTALADITRKGLTVTASSPANIIVGAPAPVVTASYAGFVPGDSAANSFATPPQCGTTYTPSSPIGTYPTSCSGAVAANYTIGYVAGSLKVEFGWTGFLQPINDTAHQTGVTQSKFKAGQTIPAKFVIRNAAGAIVQQASVPSFSRSGNRGSCDPSAQLESAEAVPADNVPIYTWDGAQYHYNWSTKGLSGGVYRIYANLADGNQQWVDICLTK